MTLVVDDDCEPDMSYRKPTIEDVAREAGVSRATASRAMNNMPGASGLTRARVAEVAATLGYRPNQAARALASGRRMVVDLVVVNYDPDLSWIGSHPYFSRVIAGMMSALDGSTVHLQIHVGLMAGAAELIDTVARQATVGAVLVNVPPDLAIRFQRRCPRVVSLNTPASSVPIVESENTAGAYTAVGHLHQIGCRRIAAIHGPSINACASSRRAGHLGLIGDAGVPDIAAGGGFLREGGYRAAAQLLAQHPEVDGLFVSSDLMAAGAVHAITATGRRIPDDIAVVGFDDSIAAVCANPPLSTMRLPVEEMAAAATKALLDGDLPSSWQKTFPVQLITRQSTDPTAAAYT
ncbi:LacI family DNA-binding transcriptional regulator [Acrocarpospora catenulata]|uniref:LacI family DNA-binding transcriptional regulator n=1 Tax=Acrocarpospora catenulata TaxID=2836182 RepID=UPI001BDB47C0|nr:LacI family DNA-binding transcriptional regulator [Acrocarpospora catenulata]